MNRSVTEQLSIVPINPTIHGWQSGSRLSPWPWQSTKISVTRPSLRVRVSYFGGHDEPPRLTVASPPLDTVPMGQVDEAAQIAEVIVRVAATYPDISTADVTRVVQTMRTGFDDAKVREFVPLLVERKARAVLAHRQTSLNWTT